MSVGKYPNVAEVINEAISAVQQTEKLFDVTAIIGSVYRGGNQTSRVAAFVIIAESDLPGQFTFPDNGEIVTVSVEHTQAQ